MEKSSGTMTFTELMRRMGDFSYYQIKMVIWTSLPVTLTSAHALAIGFVAFIPKVYRCFIDGVDDNLSLTAAEREAHINYSIPLDPATSAYSRCLMYDPGRLPNASLQAVKCSKWLYDTSQTSRGMDWNMVCDQRYMLNLAQSLYMAGMLVGAIGLGSLSDRFGRRPVFLASIQLTVLSGLLMVAAPQYIYFVICRFLLGVFHSGVLNTGFVIVMEMVGPKGQVWGGILHAFSFGIGFISPAVLSTFLREWWQIQLAITLPGLLFIPFWWIIPESSRWLTQEGRFEEALKLLADMKKDNKTEIPSDIKRILQNIQGQERKEEHNFTHLLKTPRMRLRSFNVFYQWFVVSMIYWGISLNLGKIPGGTILVNYLLGGLMGYATFPIMIVAMLKIGRKPIQIVCMIASGIGCIVAAVVPKHIASGWLQLAFTLFASKFAGSGFSMVFQYSAEAFPTTLRNTAVGSGSVCARIGSILAPFIYLLGEYTHEMVPIFTFAAFSLLAGFLACYLPETKNQPLPETMEDGEIFGMKNYKELMLEKISRRRHGTEEHSSEMESVLS